MIIDVQGKGATRLDRLNVGDSVLTADGTYSKVYSFGHRDPLHETEFLQIQTKDSMDAPLEITADHLLYAFDEGTQKTSLLPAGNIKTGDSLLTVHGLPTEVVSIHMVQRHGIYAPFTVTGDLVVNGIAASNYIALPPAFQTHMSYAQQHWIQHGTYTPYRLYCLAFDCKHEARDEATGFSIGTAMWLPLLHWLEGHRHVILPSFLYLVAIPGHWILLLVEQAIFNIGHLLAVAFALGYFFKKKINGRLLKQKKGEWKGFVACD